MSGDMQLLLISIVLPVMLYIRYKTIQPDSGNPLGICPHCQTKGEILERKFTSNAGASSGKATAAVMTGGSSWLAVHLSRRQPTVERICGRCHSAWTIT
jgi:hypothetical protein